MTLAPLRAAQPPNIVFILCDDLGIGDVRCFNPDSKIATPHIDQMAATGMRFTDAHSGSAVCTPTRYGILCGRYAWRTRLQQGVLGGLSPSLIAADQWTVPKLLKTRGYHAACIGKWHLGLDWRRHAGKTVAENSIETADQVRSVDYDQPFSGGPMAAGFDHFFGISASLDMVPYVYLSNDRVTESPTIETSFGMKFADDKSQTRKGPGAEGFTAEDVMPRLTQEAIAYLEQRAAEPDRPFFLYLPFASPHTPIAPTPQWLNKSGLNPYADFVMQQDDSLGQIMAALERLKLDQNTVVFFTSDNGCSPQADYPALEAKGHRPSYRYRGHKADIFEGGHRIPLIVRWPGMVGHGAQVDQTVCLVDLMATAADIAKIDLPEDAAADSFSLLPLLQDANAEPLRASTVHHSINGTFALRRGDYKLCFCNDSGGWSDPKPVARDVGATLQLFDLANDVAETTNLAEKHPEIVQRMAREMEAIISRGRSTSGPAMKNDVEIDLWKRAQRPAELDEAPKSTWLAPLPWQVIQRRYYVPQLANPHQPGGAKRGLAEVQMRIESQYPNISSIQYAISAHNDERRRVIEWTTIAMSDIDSHRPLNWSVRIPAGGWYRAHVRLMSSPPTSNSTAASPRQLGETLVSEPFGVGELFLVAGQSYATNTNEELLRVRDPYQRVAAYQLQSQSWRVAHDPQPVVDNSRFGSIWPAVGDRLVATLDVPIGFANIAWGGTSSSQWLPEQNLHKQMVAAGQQLGDFRALLWQQGESDVIEQATTSAYVERLVKIRAAAEEQWQVQRPWFLAKSTLHPTVYRRPEGEARIRAAIDQLVSQHGFLQGPDTDLLAGPNRGPVGSRRHFSAVGQQAAASMWYAALLGYLQQSRPAYEAVMEQLPAMHLRQPAWASSIVVRESSLLIQQDPEAALEARLAFPAAEIVSVQRADGSPVPFGRELTLSEDGLRLIWKGGAAPVEPITVAQMYPPQDAPNSYRHRASNPEQNLFYAPGNYFHLRNLEITYRRADTPATNLTANLTANLTGTLAEKNGTLPRTLAKLRNKSALRIAISGDSISTGLDASGTTYTTPNQPGYPELVAAQLASDYGCSIELTNRSVAGWSIAQGVQDLKELLASRPDLLIVAYGMNDVGRRDPTWFLEQAQQIDREARAAQPELEIIWVAPMLGNKEWVHTPREMFAQYRDALRSLSGEHSALADLTEVWTKLLQNKHDLDLTGNGLNHPNDFGHRLYAQAILIPLSQESR